MAKTFTEVPQADLIKITTASDVADGAANGVENARARDGTRDDIGEVNSDEIGVSKHGQIVQIADADKDQEDEGEGVAY